MSITPQNWGVLTAVLKVLLILLPPTVIVLALSVVTSIPKAVIGVLEKSKNVATLLSLYASALVPSVTLKAD